MAAKRSIAPDIVWNWVIEPLATSKQADISTLIGLAIMSPAISGDAGNCTREIVSLSIMENLFDHRIESTMAAKTPTSFDSSVRCEYVLKKILRKTPEPLTKWDVGHFLMHKRSSLPKCMLIKLKESIHADCNPLLASLKEKSKLVTSNASKDTNPANDEWSTIDRCMKCKKSGDLLLCSSNSLARENLQASLTARPRKRKAKQICSSSPPPVLFLRRRNPPWTKSEEETLKEGVKRYSSANNAKIPWKEILAFGHNVFYKGRTTIDLKDKWRNMCKNVTHMKPIASV